MQTASGAFGDPLFLKITDVWAKWTNAHGGINGHPVKVIAVDDAGNPAQGLSAVKKLVEQDHVVAIVGSQAGTFGSWTPYLEQKHVPIIGGAATGNTTGSPKYGFPAALGVSELISAQFELYKSLGFKTVANLLAQGAGQNVQQFEAALSSAAAATGVKIVYTTTVSPTSPDFTAPCLSVKNSKADIAAVGISPTVTLNIIKTCMRQGYAGAYLTTNGLANPAWDKDSDLRGATLYLVDDVWPFDEQRTQAQKDYFAAINQYDPGMLTNAGYNAYVQSAWVAFQLFRTAAENAKLTPTSTGDDLLPGLYAIKNNTLDGLTGPLTFSASDKLHVDNCYYISQLKDGQWSNVGADTTHCVTP
ncbi:ABC transporter substrate-binding protein [Jatrophihabitans cynanchi]|uniref:ABC transporter substrate-binding protein n=1 Tax=Jatrophihabitans cynanchi TaxID=2944128 RepID=A0ABY7K1N9_9ACTN|nr:ABC transporter substrate-binding protein [Jatrophihabitans sp. SB3-54]